MRRSYPAFLQDKYSQETEALGKEQPSNSGDNFNLNVLLLAFNEDFLNKNYIC